MSGIAASIRNGLRPRGRGARAVEGQAARVHAAAHRDDVPAHLRRGDGLQRQLERLAPQRRRQPLLPEEDPDVRGGRAGRPEDPLDAAAPERPRAHRDDPDRRDRPAARHQGDGHLGQRCAALARIRADPDPGLGDREDRADALRGEPPGRSADDDPRPAQHAADPADRGNDLRPDRPRAGPRHRDGHRLLDRGTPDRRRGEAPPPGDDRRGAAAPRPDRGADGAVPDGPPDQLHQPRRGRVRGRIPGPAGLDRARLRRHLRRRDRRERPEGLLPARGPHRHDRRGHRRGARADRHLAARRPLHAVRVRRVQDRPEGAGSLRSPARRRVDGDDSGPGVDQPLRRPGPGPPDRSDTPIRLLRKQQPDRHARGRWPAPQRAPMAARRGCRRAGSGVACGSSTAAARRSRTSSTRRSAARGGSRAGGDRSRRYGGTRGTGAGRRRRAR